MFEKIIKNIEQFDSIVIFGHIYPDGDAFGSQIALKRAITQKYPNKTVYAVGSGVGRFFNVIGSMDVVPDSIIKNSLAILVDSNDLSRSEDKRIYTAKAWIKLDHHIENNLFTQGDFVLIEDANSTCEVVYKFLVEQNLPIDEITANALYLGILTDTARFQYMSKYSESFMIASDLCQKGANPYKLNEILNTTNEASMRFKGYVFSHYEKTDKGVIYLKLTQKTLKRFNLPFDKAARMVNLISNVQGFPIWAFFTETPEGKLDIEIRSSCYDVQSLCASYGGGGHMMAAGATIDEFSDAKIKEILKKCDELMEA